MFTITIVYNLVSCNTGYIFCDALASPSNATIIAQKTSNF